MKIRKSLPASEKSSFFERIEWGTAPQWVSACAAVATFAVALFAFHSPVFQNQVLKEDNAQLAIDNKALQSNKRVLVTETTILRNEKQELLTEIDKKTNALDALKLTSLKLKMNNWRYACEVFQPAFEMVFSQDPAKIWMNATGQVNLPSFKEAMRRSKIKTQGPMEMFRQAALDASAGLEGELKKNYIELVETNLINSTGRLNIEKYYESYLMADEEKKKQKLIILKKQMDFDVSVFIWGCKSNADLAIR